MSAAVASISDGWLKTPSQKCDYTIACFFVSDASQSYLFNGRVASLASIIQQYGNSTTQLSDVIVQALTLMMSGYFDSVNVDCSVKSEDTIISGKTDVTTTITVIDNGTSYSAGYLVKALNGRVAKIIKLDNDGG